MAATLIILAACLASTLAVDHGLLVTLGNGELVRIVDNCTPGNDTMCPTGHCCAREGLSYIPEYTGPKPSHQIICAPYKKVNEFCYRKQTTETCPCDLHLVCNARDFFGHCVVPVSA